MVERVIERDELGSDEEVVGEAGGDGEGVELEKGLEGSDVVGE